jgi:hypothetical protein
MEKLIDDKPNKFLVEKKKDQVENQMEKFVVAIPNKFLVEEK